MESLKSILKLFIKQNIYDFFFFNALIYDNNLTLKLQAIIKIKKNKKILTFNRYIYGNEEAKQKKKSASAVESESSKSLPEQEDALFALNTIGSMTESVSTSDQSDILQKLWEDMKHISCPHSLSCMQYVIQVIMIRFSINFLKLCSNFDCHTYV